MGERYFKQGSLVFAELGFLVLAEGPQKALRARCFDPFTGFIFGVPGWRGPTIMQ